MLVPKGDELIADPFRHNGRQAAAVFFEDGIRQVFGRMREACNHEYPATVYYAFKQAESIRGRSRETTQHRTAAHFADFLSRGFQHHMAMRHLSVSADGQLCALLHRNDCGSVKGNVFGH